MDKKDLRIVFMGTPEFAVASLQILVENNFNVVGVITMPDKPGGRGHKLQCSAVKKYALENNIPLLQPEKLKDEDFISKLKKWNAGLQVVVAFRMLPEIVWNMPRFGTFNLHASLLPQYRGAAPINWAIINGEKETGVTTFFLNHEIDTGKIILQHKIPIAETDNAGIIHDKLMTEGAQLVKQTVEMLLNDQINAIPQEQLINDEKDLKTAPKIFKETCRINWNNSCRDIYNFIRGLSPYPGAWSEMLTPERETIIFKIFASEKIIEHHNFQPGTFLTDNKNCIDIACADGFIRIVEIQMPGKKRMKTKELLLGHKFKKEDIVLK